MDSFAAQFPVPPGTGQIVGPLAAPGSVYLTPEQVEAHRRHQEVARTQELFGQATTMDAQAAIIRARPPLSGWLRLGLLATGVGVGYAVADAIARGKFFAPASRAAVYYASRRWGGR